MLYLKKFVHTGRSERMTLEKELQTEMEKKMGFFSVLLFSPLNTQQPMVGVWTINAHKRRKNKNAKVDYTGSILYNIKINLQCRCYIVRQEV